MACVLRLEESVADITEEAKELHYLLDESEAQHDAAAEDVDARMREVVGVLVRFAQRHGLPAPQLRGGAEAGEVAQQVEGLLYRAMAHARAAANEARLEQLRTVQSQSRSGGQNASMMRVSSTTVGYSGLHRSASSESSSGEQQRMSAWTAQQVEAPPPPSPPSRTAAKNQQQPEPASSSSVLKVTFSGARTTSGSQAGELGLPPAVSDPDTAQFGVDVWGAAPPDAAHVAGGPPPGVAGVGQMLQQHSYQQQQAPHVSANQVVTNQGQHPYQQQQQADVSHQVGTNQRGPPGIIERTGSMSSEEGDAVAMMTFGNTTASPAQARPSLTLSAAAEQGVEEDNDGSPRPPQSLAAMRASSKLVDEEHKQYELVFCMLLGIQTMVEAQRAERLRTGPETATPVARSWHGQAQDSDQLAPVLTTEDYDEKKVVFFPPEGSIRNGTPPHEYGEFKFKTFAPKAFRAIRKCCGIEESNYLASLCDASAAVGAGAGAQEGAGSKPGGGGGGNPKKFVLREVSMKSKSNSFFFYSHDVRFLVKTISVRELCTKNDEFCTKNDGNRY